MSKSQLLPLPPEWVWNSKRESFPLQIAFVSTLWHEELINQMLQSAEEELKQLNKHIQNSLPSGINVWTKWRVPGAFEIPHACKRIQKFLKKHHENSSAIITFGCILKGETKHNEYIAHSVFHALQTLNIKESIPIILGILTPDTYEQAMARADITARNCVRAALWQVLGISHD